MTTGCLVCLDDTGGRPYHPRCLDELFGVTSAPRLDLELAKLHTVALAMVGHVALSGVQRKISMDLAADRLTLQVSIAGGRYIVKPQAGTYPELPENEHVTMKLAKAFGLATPPCGLVHLKDNTLAYVVLRFDRPAGGGKVRQEDFCQLAGLAPKEKYDASAELCVRLTKRYASEPLIEVLKLYRLLLFAWWTGNGDLHLKNLSVYIDASGRVRLTPVYDLVNTRLLIADDALALPVAGRKDRLTRHTWLEFAKYCGLLPRAAARVLNLPAQRLDAALQLLDRSALSQEFRDNYKDLLKERAGALVAPMPPRRP